MEFPTLTETHVVEEPGGVHEAMVDHAETRGLPSGPVDWFHRAGRDG